MLRSYEDLVFAVLKNWRTYYILSWLLSLFAASVALFYAWHSFDTERVGGKRPEENSGHATIDFGGQWLMGRMLVTGHADQLYNRNVQRLVLRDAYPENPESTERSDVENLMYWMMGEDIGGADQVFGSTATPLAAADSWQAAVLICATNDHLTEQEFQRATTIFAATDPLQAVAMQAVSNTKLTRVELASKRPVGGPLYPPVNAYFYAPLGMMLPPRAYRVQQIFNVVLVYFAGFGVSYLSRGRFWAPVAATAIMLFPGYAGSINLGQNAILTLTILIWGWAFTARGRPILGGIIWGFLAFKPVWALVFLLVPLLSGRWRMLLAMCVSGATLALLTLPVVGLHSWFDWLTIGKEAAETYDKEKNWIFLSRDILSMPRRWLLDFDPKVGRDERLLGTLWDKKPWALPTKLAPTLIGYAILLVVLECTVRVAVLKRSRRPAPDGPPAAFLCLGAWMCCFHFMYYDALLGALGLFVLATEPRRFLTPLLLAIIPLRPRDVGHGVVRYHEVAPPEGAPPIPALATNYRHVWVLNRMLPTAYAGLLIIHYVFPLLDWGTFWGPPWDTYLLMGVWAWCGWQWLKHGEKVATSWDDPPQQGAPQRKVVEEVPLKEIPDASFTASISPTGP
jgi:hypothetical protein